MITQQKHTHPKFNNNHIICKRYFREYEITSKNTLPQLVQYIIYLYSKEYIVIKMPLYQNMYNKFVNYSNSESCNLYSSKMKEHLYTATTIDPKTVSGIGSILNIHINKTFITFIKDTIIDIKYGGSNHTLFLTSIGTVYSCGKNGSGQCGIFTNGQPIIKPQLIPMKNNTKISEIAAGKLHSLFIDSEQRLLVCGYNYCGQLAYPNDMDMLMDDDSSDSDTDSYFTAAGNLTKYTPTINEYFEEKCIKFVKISCGLFHSICIAMNGECYTFGHNGYGNLGNGDFTEWGEGEWEPYKLNINNKIINVSSGDNHNVLLTNKHQIWTFGNNSENQCSNIINDKKILSPMKISKCNEFGICDNCYIENVICSDNETFIIIDRYCRI